MQRNGQLPNIYLRFAQKNALDTYSYQYDAMDSHPIVFSNATGLATGCLHDGQIDAEKFQTLANENKETKIIEEIAFTHLNIDNFSLYARLRNRMKLAKITAHNYCHNTLRKSVTMASTSVPWNNSFCNTPSRPIT